MLWVDKVPSLAIRCSGSYKGNSGVLVGGLGQDSLLDAHRDRERPASRRRKEV